MNWPYGCPKVLVLLFVQCTEPLVWNNVFSVCTRVKNVSRGGDVFGCHSLGEGGENFFIHRKKSFLKNFLTMFFLHSNQFSTFLKH